METYKNNKNTFFSWPTYTPLVKYVILQEICCKFGNIKKKQKYTFFCKRRTFKWWNMQYFWNFAANLSSEMFCHYIGCVIAFPLHKWRKMIVHKRFRHFLGWGGGGGGDIRKVYAKLRLKYCNEISWLQYQTKFEMNNAVNIVIFTHTLSLISPKFNEQGKFF